MNPRVAQLPQFRGIPVPFFVTWRTDGIPDFKVMDERKRLRCASERLCWVCGQRLDYWIVFVGGPRSIEHRFFMDGPCHPECAHDARELCPFLLGRADYGTADLSKHANHVEVQERILTEPPTKFALYTTRGFKVAIADSGWLFQAAPARSIEWFERPTR